MKLFKKRKKLKLILLVFVLITTVTAFVANYYVKKHGYRNLWDFVQTYWTNKKMAANAKFETLEIKIDQSDFEKLEAVREKALKRGILIDEGGSYVNARLIHNGKKIKAKLRLKGHMTDHLQDKKWSFRIKTKRGDAFLGMRIFSLQHPGTRNYVYEWIYHQMMRQEGIIALRYDFIKVKVNGEDWGIYAVEEHFGQELIENNKRPPGPVLRFNPDMYWAWRIAEQKNEIVKMESASFQSAGVEAYNDEKVFSDSTLLYSYQQGMLVMEKFRRRIIPVSQAFDVEKLAKFHAIIDLVGGHHSLDWSDVKYYYNNITGKLEPVAYESFGVRESTIICGSYRYQRDTASIVDLHNALFSDPVFFARYIKELKRIATVKWLDAFLHKEQKQLDNKLAILYKEFAYKTYKPDPYYRNIKLISRILNPVKGLDAYVDNWHDDSICLSVGGIDALPYQLKTFQIDTVKINLPETYVAAKQKDKPVDYTRLKINIPNLAALHPNAATKMKIIYTLPGASKTMVAKVIPIKTGFSPNFLNPGIENHNDAALEDFDFLSVNPVSKIISMKEGRHVLDKNLHIPPGYKFIAQGNLIIDLIKGSCIFSGSPVFFNGKDEENMIRFISSDGTGKGLVVLAQNKQSSFANVSFENLGSVGETGLGTALLFYESVAKISRCNFLNSKLNDIVCVRSNIQISDAVFSNPGNDAIKSCFSKLIIVESSFTNVHDDAIDAEGSVVKVSLSNFNKIGSIACKSEAKSEAVLYKVTIDQAAIAIESAKGSDSRCSDSAIRNCTLAFKAAKTNDVYGASSISANKIQQYNNKSSKLQEKGSVVSIK